MRNHKHPACAAYVSRKVTLYTGLWPSITSAVGNYLENIKESAHVLVPLAI